MINKKSLFETLEDLRNSLKSVVPLFLITIVVIMVFVYITDERFFGHIVEDQRAAFYQNINDLILQVKETHRISFRRAKSYLIISEDGQILKSMPEGFEGLNIKGSTLFQKLKGLKSGQKLMFLYPDIFTDGKTSVYLAFKHGDYLGLLTLEISESVLIPRSDYHVFVLSGKDICIYSDLKNSIGERINSPPMQFGRFYYWKKFELFSGMQLLILNDVSKSIYLFLLIVTVSTLVLVYIVFKGHKAMSSINGLTGELNVINDVFIDFKESLSNLIEGTFDVDKFFETTSKLSLKVEILNFKCQFEESQKYRDLLEEFIVLINNLSNEITASFQELRAFNEELENLTYSLETLNEKYELIMNSIAEIEPDVEIEKLMKKLLDIAMVLVPEAEGGSISLVRNGSWEFVTAKNYDEKILGSLKLKAEWLLQADENIFVVKDIMKKNESIIPEDIFKKMLKAMNNKRPEETIIGTIRDENGNVLGHIALDIFGKGAEFSSSSKEAIYFLIKLASNLMIMKKYYEHQRQFQQELIKLMIMMLEMKDRYTKGHSERVARISKIIAQKMGLPNEEMERLYFAALIHDVGKVSVPNSILNKPSRLTAEEYEVIKQHPALAADMLVAFNYLRSISEIVRYHHERWDGKGYPEGLKGEEIPLLSRILALADAFDAMTSDRSYRRALPLDWALREVMDNSGKQFDPKLVEVFLEIVREGGVLL